MGTLLLLRSKRMMVANMYFLTLSLVIILSEARIPPPPSPSPTTTKAPSSSTTKAPTTTAKPKDCPMDGKTCLADNLIEMKSADGADACNDECKKTADSKCKFWTYVPTRKICFILSSCVEKTEEGSISGENGCVIPSSKLSVFNLTAKTIKIEWENSVCANEEIAELETLKNKEVKYCEKPDSLKCGKLKKVSGSMDATACKDLENAEAGDIYIKTDLTDVAKCEIALTPKTLG